MIAGPNDIEAQKVEVQVTQPAGTTYVEQHSGVPAGYRSSPGVVYQQTVQQQPSMIPGANVYSVPPASMNVTPAKATTTTTTTSTHSPLVRLAESLEWGTQMFLIAFFSLMVMIVAAQNCDSLRNGDCEDTRAYEVAVGAFSFAIAFIAFLLHFFGWLHNVTHQAIVSTFLFVWWVAGVIILTFFGDFQSTQNANGYFGAWGAFIMSAFALVAVSPRFEEAIDRNLHAHSIRKPLFFIALASAVVMGAAIAPCSPHQNCRGYSLYALIVGTFSLLVALVFLLIPTRLERSLMRYVAWFFLLWWAFGTGVLTLGGPFRQTGNGYFGSFAALLSTIGLFRALHYHDTAAA